MGSGAKEEYPQFRLRSTASANQRRLVVVFRIKFNLGEKGPKNSIALSIHIRTNSVQLWGIRWPRGE